MKCQVVISRGRNKGKICGDINQKCKHTTEPMVCSICGTSYTRSTSYYRHIKTHETQSQVRNDKTVDLSKKKLNIRKKTESSNTNDTNEALAAKVRELQQQVTELQGRETVTNYNIAVIGTSDDLYQELIRKMGGNRETAVSFLANSCTKGKPLEVFEKLYLDGKSPDDYPVACRDNLHFRYLDPDRKLIDDQGGSSIGKLVSNQLMNTFLLASNDKMRTEGEVTDKVIQFQERVIELANTQDMIAQLAEITTNPNHPFFVEDKKFN